MYNVHCTYGKKIFRKMVIFVTECLIFHKTPPFYEVKWIRRKRLPHGGISKICFLDHFLPSFLGQNCNFLYRFHFEVKNNVWISQVRPVNLVLLTLFLSIKWLTTPNFMFVLNLVWSTIFYVGKKNEAGGSTTPNLIQTWPSRQYVCS